MSIPTHSTSCCGASLRPPTTGHDRPELYALRVPEKAGVLELVAVVGMPTGGQAIDWDRTRPRLLWSIERKTKQLVASRIPRVAAR